MTRLLTSPPLVLALASLMIAVGNDAHAQRSQELSFQSANQLGLTPVWSRAISTGIGGKVTGVTFHVSPTKTYQASEVIDKFGRRVFFSQRDPDLGVSRAGYDQVARLTDLKKAELAARGLDPRVEAKTIQDVTLYVRSSLGTIMALDAETGSELWITQAGTAGYPNYPISATEEHLVTLSGSSIYVVDAVNGQVLDTISARKVPATRPTLYDGFIYLPTRQGLIEVYDLDDLSHVEYTMGSSGRIENRVTVSPDAVSWTTDQGFIYVARTGRPGIQYRFHSRDIITSAPVYLDGMLFATSMEGFTYAIDEATGVLKWTYSAGGSTDEAPLALEGLVFVTTTQGQMACLDAASGEPKWRASGVNRFVAISESRLYCVTEGHNLTVLDKNTGGRIASAPIGSSALPIVNTTTDRVYLVSSNGILQCLRESANRWPLVRMPPVKESEDAEPSETQEAPLEEATPIEVQADVPSAQPAPDDTDPFDLGAGAAEDTPDQDDAGADDPFSFDDESDAGDAGAEDDPFAEFE